MADKDHRPLNDRERTLGQADLALIWFGAAIAITEIWAGGQGVLTGLGLGLGLTAIVLGRVIGNGLMGAMARIGALTALPGMVLTRPAFGIRGSYLPALFNILQLIGWTGFMLFVGFTYLDRLAEFTGLPVYEDAPYMKYVWVGLLTLLCILWAAGGKRWWQLTQRVSGVLLFLLTVAMTVIVLQDYSLAELFARPAAGGSLLGGADFAVAMSVSWLPLVADYSRYCKKPRAAFNGTFWGYFIGGTWMYAVGLLVALATGTTDPDHMVIQVMGGQGAAWALTAIVLVLLSTVTTTFLDIFSAVVSTQNIAPRLPEKAGNVIAGLLGMGVALGLSMEMYTPFLLAIGAIFLPAFTVVLVDFHFLARQRISTGQINERGGKYWYTAGFNWRAILAWAVGFVVYDLAGGWQSVGYFAARFGTDLSGKPWSWGSSLPCIVATAVAYLLITAVFGRGIRKD